jgi:hypothetical protein
MHSVSRPVRRLATVLTSIGLAALVAAGTVLAGTPVTVGFKDHGYAGGAFRPASDKPQSKLWYTDEGGGNVQWWGGMFRFSTSPPLSEFRIYKLSADRSTWSPTTTVVDRRDNSHGDYLWDETADTLYVASVGGPNTSSPFAVPATPDDVRIFRYTYDNTTHAYTQIGGSGSYRAILGTGSTASPAYRGGAWSVTIDKDSSGRLWVVLAQATMVLYSISDDNGQTWTPAAQLPSQGSNTINVGTMSHSDIAAVIAFGSPARSEIGVMWSDQDALPTSANNGYYFSSIAAGDDPTVGGNWSTQKLPVPAGLNTAIYSDNHINMKATSDGALYMVGKARSDTANCATLKTRMLTPLYRRTAGGTWEAARLVGTAGDCETRPQIVISEELDTMYVFLTAPNGGGTIFRKSAPLSGPDAFDFRGSADEIIKRGVPFIKSASETLIDDASTTKQEVTSDSGIAVIANNLVSSAGTNFKFYLHNYMALPSADSTPPVGTVTINGGAAATLNPVVSVSVPATDSGSGMSLLRVSNNADMSNATTFSYGTPVAWTLPGGDGTKTVYVEWRDAAGNWSSTQSDSINLITSDPTPPTATGIPAHSICCSGATGFPIRVAWTAASDPQSNIDHYELYMSVNGALFTKVTDTTATSHTFTVTTSTKTYRFAVRAVNTLGVPGVFRYGPTFRTISYSEASAAVKFSSGWGLSSDPAYVGGKAKYSVTAGRSATLTFNGNRVSWLSPMGPNMGSARVYINGSLVRTVSLYSATPVARKLVFGRTFSTTATRTIKIVVVGTAGHPRVIVDQIYVMR